MNFIIIGYGGYIAPRHINAINKVGGKVIAAFDIIQPNDEHLQLMPGSKFFSDYKEFKRFLSNSVNGSVSEISYAIICSPNHLHFEHIVDCLNARINVVCEKPIVGSINEINQLEKLEFKKKRQVFSILQLRYHQAILDLKSKVSNFPPNYSAKVDLTYIAGRDKDYLDSWKGDNKKSFGIEANIGIHFFDMLEWIFGDLEESYLYLHEPTKSSGFFMFDKARVKWFLSIDAKDIPSNIKTNITTFRSINIDGLELDFSSHDGFIDLHTVAYQEILSGRGLGLQDAKSSIAILEKINSSLISDYDSNKSHSYLEKI